MEIQTSEKAKIFIEKALIKVLLVEDEEIDTRLVKRILTKCPQPVEFAVEPVKSLSAAVEYLGLSRAEYDIVLLDLGLPDSNGIETLRQIQKVAPDIPVVVLTGLGDEETGITAIQNGAMDYLIKGMPLDLLLARTLIYARERYKIEQQIRTSLKQEGNILREIHNQIKHNIQVIYSCLGLQAKTIKDKESIDILNECQDRIKALALIHEEFYHSRNLLNIYFSGYIKELIDNLVCSHRLDISKIAIETDVEGVSLGIGLAVPCGLLLNELISNSLRHAFAKAKNGKLKISLCETEKGEIELIVKSHGIGVPENFKDNESPGMQVVSTLVAEGLQGKLELNRNEDIEFRIVFKNITIHSSTK
jgi:two-component sensor histidine kinase